MRKETLSWVVGVFVFLLCGIAVAQVTTGTISGTVKDSTGAVLPGARVVLLNDDAGSTRTVQADAAGRYSASALSLGNYRVTATLEGFQTVVRSGIVLTVGQEAVVDLVLTVGAVTQTVEVTGEAPVIETTSATLSGLVNQEQMRELPLNGRSFTDLALLSPGAFINFHGDGKQAAQGFGARISVNGSRQDANLYLLDGTTTNDAANFNTTAGGLSLGVEAIREFRILTHNFSAEYGKSSGAVVSAVTRTGTNEFHGSVYEFVRNNIFDARNFFNPGKLPAFRRNQFGASLGGPVLKDRIFFFANYEGLRQTRGVTVNFATVDDNTRRGLLPDPVTGGLRSVPVSPLIKPYIDLYPLATGRSYGDGTAEVRYDFPAVTRDDYSMERMDFRLSDKDNFYWRYVYELSEAVQPRDTSAFKSVYGGTNHFVALGETRIVSATALNDFRFAFNRTDRNSNSSGVNRIDPALAFIPGNGEQFGLIRWSGVGLPQLGPARGQPQVYITNLFQTTDIFSVVRSGHTLKFGVDLERHRFNGVGGSDFRGNQRFSSLEGFLAARPLRWEAGDMSVSSHERGYRRILLGWFIQDDYRLRSNLTLNLGFRHEFFTNPSEVNGRSASLRQITDPQSTLGPPRSGCLLQPGGRTDLAGLRPE